jgi:hypothetical protein
MVLVLLKALDFAALCRLPTSKCFSRGGVGKVAPLSASGVPRGGNVV